MPDYGGYERSRGDIDYKYSQDSATNAYGRFISQQRGQRTLGDMSRQFGRAYPRLGGTFNRRGLAGGGLSSGVQRQAMQDFVGDYARDYGRTQQDITQGLQQYDLAQVNLDAWKNQSLADLEAQKANEIAQAAQGIQYIKQLLGGL